MTTPYTITKSNGSTLALIYPYESIGPTPGGTGAASTPLQVGCRFDIPIVSQTAGQIILAGDVATLFGTGFQFTIGATTYTVATSTYNVGLTQTFVTAAGIPVGTGNTCELQVFTIAGDQTSGRNYYQSGVAFQISDPNNALAIDNGTYTVLTGHNAVYDSVSGYTAVPSQQLIPASSPFVLSQYQISYNLPAYSVLDMVGMDSLNWGAKIWENMLRTVEHFADSVSPDINPNIGTNTALAGQIWYNTTSGLFEYYNGTLWQNLGNATGGEAAEVTQIIAGTNITLSPSIGQGIVTINASGGSITAISGITNQTSVTSPSGPTATVGLATNVIVPTPTTGIALTVNGNNTSSNTTMAIQSTFSSGATSPLLSLVSTAVGGFATLSISSNGTVGTNDLSIFQVGTTLDATIVNRAPAGHLFLGTAGTTFVELFPDGGSVFGAPSGGDKGFGTINAQQLYVNGVAVGAGAGSVTSVAVSSTNNSVSYSGSPITTLGTINLSVNSAIVPYLALANTFSNTNTFTTVNTTTISNAGNISTNTLTAVGNITSQANILAYQPSDRTLKTNIKNIASPLSKVLQISGVEFDWTDKFLADNGGEDGYFFRKHDVGVIAQDVEAIMPEVVGTRKDGLKGVRYDKLVPLLIEAIKELKAEIEQLKGK